MASTKLVLRVLILILSVFLIISPFFGADSFSASQEYTPVPQIEHVAFGFRMPLADLLWLRAIQDFDYCEQLITERDCKNKSWLFTILDAITELSPDFLIGHRYGALALSVIISDVQGATVIWDKAVSRFPRSWTIPYNAGTHAILEEKNPTKAAKYYEIAAQRGAPQWVYSLSAKLYSEAGQREAAERLYEQSVAEGLPEDILTRMRKRLQIQ